MRKLIATLFPVTQSADVRKSVWESLILRFTGLALIFLSQILLARLMGVKGYGEYTVIMTALNFLVVLSLFGLDTGVLRFLPTYIQKSDYASVHGFLRFSYRVITFLAIVCSIGIFAFLLSNAKKYHIGFSEAIFWSVLLLPFLAFVYQASSVLRALQRIKTSLLPVYFLFPLTMSLGWWYYYSDHNKLPVDAAMMINLICTVLVFIYIYRRVARTVNEIVPVVPPKQESRLWLSVSATVLLTSMLNMLLKQSDILFVSYFLGNTAAGTYSAAAKMAMLVALGLSVIDYVYIPKIAALWENRKLIGLQKLVRDGSRQILWITIPVALVLIIGGKWLLSLFGPAFTGSYIPLIILIVGQLINAVTGMVGGVLMMTGHQRSFFLFYFLSFLIQVALNYLLIPGVGIIGAAIASATAVIFLNLIGYFYIRRKIKISASAF
ncbi:MAG: flippase [Bacteroidia bacterium]|nr:flippase [Bacteroidia bacterium]